MGAIDAVLGRGRTKLTGGGVVARMLATEGVEHVFGIIDGTYFGLYAGLRDEGIALVSPRHETSAAHMAGAYARACGKLGVCMASNGPGVANILPGVAVEEGEGHRVLLLTSGRRVGTAGPDRRGTYQSFPQVEVTAPMTKWSCRVPSFERLPELMRRALRVSFTGRPGVVHLDIPEDILNGKHEVSAATFLEPRRYRRVEPQAPAADLVERAADMLVAAERPMLHAGTGVIHAQAYAELDRVARLLHAPVTTSWGGRAAVDERMGYAVPMVHIDLNNRVRNEADLALILGSRVGETDWWGKPPYWRSPAEQQAIQVDIDDEAIGVHKPIDLAVPACARAFLAALADALEARAGRIDVAARRAWLHEIQDARAQDRVRLDKKLADRSAPMSSAHVAAVCREVFPDDAIVVFDGGNAAVWGNFYHEVRGPGALLGTFKFGMLGAGLGQALGAKAAFPDRPVYLITGDGAMGFHPQEVETAVRHGLDITCLVLCDKQWGMVKMNQQFQLRPLKTLIKGSLGPEETINADLGEIAFDRLAEAMGARGARAADPDGLRAALEEVRAAGGTSVIHVEVDPVKHMWAPGLRAFKDMHLEPKG